MAPPVPEAHEPPPGFPLRVAAVDVGSNAIRFLAAEFSDPVTSVRLAYVRAPVRLGHEAFVTGKLATEAMEAAIAALAGFRERMEALGIHDYRAVATSAVRDSSNGRDFLRRVHEEAGLRLGTITGTEEARLVWLAIRNRFDLRDRDWIVVDLGGGSVEISLVDQAGVHWSESHPLGTVRLLEELSDEEAQSPGRFGRILEDHTAMLKVSAAARRSSAAGLIATGGNMDELAALSGVPAGHRGVRVVPMRRLGEVIAMLAELTPADRMRELGLRADRADVILPAAMIYERVGALMGAAEIVTPNVGVKDGVLLDLVDDLVAHGSHEERQERAITAGAIALGRRYQFDEAHASQVAALAIALFDAVRAHLGLAEADRRVLIAASLLHDIGQFIGYRRHHKHSHYLIANSELPGVAPDGTELVALVARYHRRADPKEGHADYGDLDRAGRSRVERLASILRIADALDREHMQRVTSIDARIVGAELTLRLQGRGDLVPERWALKKKARLFERVAGLTVRLAPDAEE